MKKKISLIIILFLIILLFLVVCGMYFFRSYDVVFDSKGGTSIATVKVMKGKTVSKPSDPLAQGYLFEGWYLNDELFDFNSPIIENITLEAHWKSILDS